MSWVAIIAWSLAACDGGKESAPTPDGGPELAIAPPQPPAPPELPSMAPCPDGWVELDLGFGTVCEPFAAEPDCAADEVAVPGMGCISIGPACDGEFAADLPASGVVYVAPGGTGDGSRARPMGSIGDALAMHPAHVALARGEHRGPVLIDHPVNIHGACAAGTSIHTTSAAAPSVGVDRSTATLTDVTIAAEGSPALAVRVGELTLRGVIVERAIDYGVFVTERATLHAERLRVEGVTSSRYDDIGLACNDGSTCEVEQAMFGPRDGGLLVVDDGTATIRRSTVMIAPHDAWLVTSEDPGRVVLEEVAARGARLVINAEARLQATHVVSDAILAVGATVTLERCWLPGAIGIGISLRSSRLVAHDVIVDAPVIEPYEDLLIASGVAGIDSVIAFDRLTVAGARSTALVAHEGTVVTGEDLTVVGIEGEAPGFAGIAVDDRSTLEAHRAVLSGFSAAGATIGESGLAEERTIVLSDVLVDGSGAEGANGIQLISTNAELDRVSFRNVDRVALNVDGNSAVNARDLHVEDADRSSKRGIEVHGGGVVTLERARFERAREHGIIVVEEGSRVEGTDVSLLESRPRECVDAPSCDAEFGIGLGLYFRGGAALDRFEIDGSAVCGVHLLYGGTVALRNGRLRHNPIALCAEHNSIDLAAVSDGVVYEDNRVMLDGVVLPVPEPEITE